MKNKPPQITPKRLAQVRGAQARRVVTLNQKAILAGWTGISEYLTAVKKNEAEIPQKQPTGE